MDKSELTTDLRGPAEIKAACVEKLEDAMTVDFREGYMTPDSAEKTVNAVLDTIIAHSQSPRTVDELVRIRGVGQ